MSDLAFFTEFCLSKFGHVNMDIFVHELICLLFFCPFQLIVYAAFVHLGGSSIKACLFTRNKKDQRQSEHLKSLSLSIPTLFLLFRNYK